VGFQLTLEIEHTLSKQANHNMW